MVDTGWITASTAANEVINANYGDWSSPSNALTSNNSDASATVYSGGSINVQPMNSNWLKLTNYAPGIPAENTITLLEVEVEGALSASASIGITEIVPVIGGTTGSDVPSSLVTSSWTTSDVARVSTYSQAQCAALFTPAIVNASNFGVAVRVNGSTGGSGANRTVYIDAVRIRITHEPPPAQPASSQHARRRRT